MKVLFAVSNENISEAIIKRYKEKYNELITYKNVYYFNAVIKELQANKTYDRIVISEDLEIFSSSNELSIDKFLLNKLNRITDECNNAYNEKVPVIFISSEKRKFASEQLSEYFNLSLYNVLLGNDRTITKICELIRNPRTKEQALEYYQIDVDANTKKQENDPVSTIEIKNILRFFRGIAETPEKFSDTFDRIVVQYNDEQLRYIIQKLPMTVKIVLEENNQNYRNLMSGKNINSKIIISNEIKNQNKTQAQTQIQNQEKFQKQMESQNELQEVDIEKMNMKFDIEKNSEKEFEKNEDILKNINIQKDNIEINDKVKLNEKEEAGKKSDKINQKENVYEDDELLSKDILEEYRKQIEDTNINIDNLKENPITNKNPFENFLEENNENSDMENKQEQQKEIQNNKEKSKALEEVPFKDIDIDNLKYSQSKDKSEYIKPILDGFINENKRIIAFIGSSKNGTSFLVNSVAVLLSSVGVKTAILDMTTNRNSYYIATSSDKELKNKASKILENLEKGNAEGIEITKTLSVFTSVPDNGKVYSDAENIYKTLLGEYDLILVDTDFNTNYGFFAGASEIFLVQSLDILTMQPFTRFLKNLKDENILKDENVKVVINKEIPLRGISRKVIVGGISTYNSPTMSYMTKLFDKDTVTVCSIPFDITVYQRYLENIVYCKYDISGYPKKFIEDLKILSGLVYPKYKTGVKVENEINNNMFEPKPFKENNTFDFSKKELKQSTNLNHNSNLTQNLNINNRSNFEYNNQSQNRNQIQNQNTQNNNLENNFSNDYRNLGGFYGFKNRMSGQNYDIQQNAGFDIETMYKPQNSYQYSYDNQIRQIPFDNAGNRIPNNNLNNYAVGRNYNMYNSPNQNFQTAFYKNGSSIQNSNQFNQRQNNEGKKRFSEKISDSLNKMKDLFK